MNSIIKRFSKLFKTRAIPLHLIREQAWIALDEYSQNGEMEYPYLYEAYMDEGENYYIVFDEGAAYRMNFTVNGGDANFDAPQKIMFTHTPVENTRFKVVRAKSGDYEGKLIWYGVACSNVVNRDGEIDSSLLFDSLVENFETYEHDVTLRFYHEDDEKFFLGDVLGIERSDNLLLAWGTLDEQHELANYVSKGINSGEYGMSIGYFPTKQDRMKIDKDVEIQVFDEGVLIEISMLKADDAAAPFTKLNAS